MTNASYHTAPEGCPNCKSLSAFRRTFIDKGVRMLLDQQIFQHPAPRHEAEKVVVAAKEYVQSHLDHDIRIDIQYV